jgi:hypothetical protein
MEVDEIVLRIKGDFSKAERDAARGREIFEKASADMARLKAALEVFGQYSSFPVATIARSISTPKDGSKAKAIVDAALPHVVEHGPTFGTVLIKIVESSGIDLGNNPKQNFASAMSRDKRVEFDRTIGWKLTAIAKEIEAEASAEGKTSASLFHSNDGGQL